MKNKRLKFSRSSTLSVGILFDILTVSTTIAIVSVIFSNAQSFDNQDYPVYEYDFHAGDDNTVNQQGKFPPNTQYWHILIAKGRLYVRMYICR